MSLSSQDMTLDAHDQAARLLDPRKLLYFATIVEQGSLKRAAGVLGVTQPALTHSLARLELEAGHKLLERSVTGVTPTLLGTRIYAHAHQIRDELRKIEHHIQAEDIRDRSGIRFGALPSLSAYVIPTALARWRRNHPDLSLEVTQKVQIELLTALSTGELDFTIGVTDIYDRLDGLRQRVLFREQLFVVCNATHRLLNGPAPSWQELRLCRWIIPPAGRHKTLLDKILEAEQLAPPPSTTFSASLSMLKSLVASGDDLALLPLHAVRDELADGRLAFLPVSSPLLTRNIALFLREGHDLRAEEVDFVSCTQMVGLELARDDIKPRYNGRL